VNGKKNDGAGWVPKVCPVCIQIITAAEMNENPRLAGDKRGDMCVFK
jgi:hypothetical protein